MIILRQKIYSRQDTINEYIDSFVKSGNGGTIIPRKWSGNGKERSRNRGIGTQIIPRTPEEDKKTILERVKKLLKRKEEQREFARHDYEDLAEDKEKK